MFHSSRVLSLFLIFSCCVLIDPQWSLAEKVNYLAFANGANVSAVSGDAKALKVTRDKALMVIDGDDTPFLLTPKPGPNTTAVSIEYTLPAATSFSEFQVPNVGETPSPSQTFFKEISLSGVDANGETHLLAKVELSRVEKGKAIVFPSLSATKVSAVTLTLSGGLSIEREKTYFEFSELIGYGNQETVPLVESFSGKWKGRGVLMELSQEESRVTGCYDKTGRLEGAVTGNILRATGVAQENEVQSIFVLQIGKDGEITGVRSTNGAPFRLYEGATAAKGTVTGCEEKTPALPGCGSILYGIQFDFNSANLKPSSEATFQLLKEGLAEVQGTQIVIEGHTSSEGSVEYNQELSERRAASVVSRLKELGMSADTLAAVGHGEGRPIASNATEAGRSLNRRVQVTCRG